MLSPLWGPKPSAIFSLYLKHFQLPLWLVLVIQRWIRFQGQGNWWAHCVYACESVQRGLNEIRVPSLDVMAPPGVPGCVEEEKKRQPKLHHSFLCASRCVWRWARAPCFLTPQSKVIPCHDKLCWQTELINPSSLLLPRAASCLIFDHASKKNNWACLGARTGWWVKPGRWKFLCFNSLQ